MANFWTLLQPRSRSRLYVVQLERETNLNLLKTSTVRVETSKATLEIVTRDVLTLDSEYSYGREPSNSRAFQGTSHCLEATRHPACGSSRYARPVDISKGFNSNSIMISSGSLRNLYCTNRNLFHHEYDEE